MDYTTGTGQKVNQVHPPEQCEGEYCVIHNPSRHHMNEWPTNFRPGGLMERMCEHDVGHPDPDSVAWLNKTIPNGAWEVHGCDGCCEPPLFSSGEFFKVPNA